jgi:maltooligosyltrehalose synthase
VIVDVVPNHMYISDPKNVWLLDVLKNGPSSPFAQFFDIDWSPPRENLANKALLPVLDSQYGQALENRRIRIHYSGGAFRVLLNGSYRDVFTGNRLRPEARQGRSVLAMSKVFSRCPVALLEKLPK